MALTAVSSGLLLDACKEKNAKTVVPDGKDAAALPYDRMEEEKVAHEQLVSQTFFTPHEMATLAVLSDIIIPADHVSGSATEAGVPEFIEFIVKDKPEFQTPMRGGLRWLDMQTARFYGKAFRDCNPNEQISIVDAIAYPQKAKPEMKQGVSFFNLMRNLTATGFYSSEMGIKDVGYVGNTPNRWNGVPDDVLQQYGLTYTQKELDESVKFD